MNPDIILKRMEDIQLYADNPRLNEKAIDAVAESMRRYRFKQPIVLDKDNVIVAGRTRYLAARKIGMQFTQLLQLLDRDPISGFYSKDRKNEL